jgi:alpha-tubulin suppressor-like RCC1 family protein
VQDLPRDVLMLIADQLSLQDVKHCREASTFFANNLAQSYIKKILQFIGQKTVVQKAQGKGFELILLKDGSVYSRGSNNFGALGLGNASQAEQFTQINGLQRITQISANTDHAYYLAQSGDVYITGQDRLALLTRLKHTNCFAPQKVPGLKNITRMTLSPRTSFFITEAGKVFGCGANDEGQVLPGHRCVVQELVELPHIADAQNVFASPLHTIVKCKNQFFSFGCNAYGQLCLGHFRGNPMVHSFVLNFLPKIIRVAIDSTYFLNDNDQLYICGKADMTYKKMTCIGSAINHPDFTRLLRTSEIDVPHEPLIMEIEMLSKTTIGRTGRNESLHPELIDKLKKFSKFLISLTASAEKITERENPLMSEQVVRI